MYALDNDCAQLMIYVSRRLADAYLCKLFFHEKSIQILIYRNNSTLFLTESSVLSFRYSFITLSEKEDNLQKDLVFFHVG